MAEEISLREVFDLDFLGVALTTMIFTEGHNNPEEIRAKFNINPEQPLNIEVTINGVSTPLRPFFKRLEDAYGAQVQKAAAQLLREKFDEKFRALYDLVSEAESTVMAKLREAGLLEKEY